MQMTFGMYEDENRRKKATMLDKVGDVIDFSKLENLLLKMYRGHTGRPPIPPLMLFKALLLESWYGLSDVELFRRFMIVEVLSVLLEKVSANITLMTQHW